jgi:branched-chain amino acid transport system ATP-binding protein
LSAALLRAKGLTAGYGEVVVLRDIDIRIDRGEIVAIVGANGAGKTTLLLSISGHLPLRTGRIVFDGEDISGQPAHLASPRGMMMVPEGGRLFPFMTVLENLQLGAFHGAARLHMRESLAEMVDMFPILGERRRQLAGRLSGGERQMVAIARAMMAMPTLLMLDEPSLGLSPLMVERVFDLVRTLAEKKGVTILLVEQNVAEALGMSNRAYVLERGRMVKTGFGSDLLGDADVQRAYMGL